MQCLITNTLQHWSEQNAFLIAQSCYAKQADSIAVSHHQCTTALVKTKCLPHCPELLCKTGRQQAVIANRPLGICSSYRCAVTQLQCTAVLIKTKCFPHYPELLCKTGLHYSTCQNKMPSSLPRAVLQNRQTAGLCHCK